MSNKVNSVKVKNAEEEMTLSDGRKLGFLVYGDNKGLPLFYFTELHVPEFGF
jgi:hypothetical protein